MRSNILRICVLALISVTITAFFAFDLHQIITLENAKNQQDSLKVYYSENHFLFALIFSISYVIITALSLPFAAIFTLLGGALFGFTNGLIITSFASTIGATLAFLITRFLLKDWVKNKYNKFLDKVNEGFVKEGLFYLFALRLAPIMPFFMINILMAFTPIKTWKFYIVSQIGMLFGTAVYVYAGTQLSQISSLSGILSPGLLFGFTLLGLSPLITKKILGLLRKKFGKNL